MTGFGTAEGKRMTLRMGGCSLNGCLSDGLTEETFDDLGLSRATIADGHAQACGYIGLQTM